MHFPFEGLIEFMEPEAKQKMTLDAAVGMKPDYLDAVKLISPSSSRKTASRRVGIDYLATDTSIGFDKALDGISGAETASVLTCGCLATRNRPKLIQSCSNS